MIEMALPNSVEETHFKYSCWDNYLYRGKKKVDPCIAVFTKTNDWGGCDYSRYTESFLNVFVTERKSTCPTHSEAKQYQNVGVWNRERFIAGPRKETGGSFHKNPELPESFQQNPFTGKVREEYG